MKIMIWSASRGGMRSVVEAYLRDGFIAQHDVKLIHSYADGGVVFRQLVLLRALALYLWTLSTRNVDLVHCHASVRGGFWRKSIFAVIARAFDIPVLFHLHGSEMKRFYGEQAPWVRRLISRQLESASRVLVLSESWKVFVSMIAPQARLIVVPNYVRMPPAPVSTPKAIIDLLFLGLVGPRKGVFDLLKAFAAGGAQCPNLRLTIAGNGQLDEAKRMALGLGIAGIVNFVGWVDDEAKSALLKTADIYVLPSHDEGLPMSVLEAMAYRLPVITTSVGGIPDLITDGVHGRLLQPGDITALERAILELARDPVIRMRFGQAGHERVRFHYSDAVVLPLLSSIYVQCARGSRR